MLCKVITCVNAAFANVCDVKSAEKRYACLKIVNYKTKMNMTCVSSHRCLGSLMVREKEFQLKGLISREDINLSRQKQNYRFYLFDKSWYFSARYVIAMFNPLLHNNAFRHLINFLYLKILWKMEQMLQFPFKSIQILT